MWLVEDSQPLPIYVFSLSQTTSGGKITENLDSYITEILVTSKATGIQIILN